MRAVRRDPQLPVSGVVQKASYLRPKNLPRLLSMPSAAARPGGAMLPRSGFSGRPHGRGGRRRGGAAEESTDSVPGLGAGGGAAESKPAGRGGVGRGGRGRGWRWAGSVAVGGAPSCPSLAPWGRHGHGTAHWPFLDVGASCPVEGGTGRHTRDVEEGDYARWGR